MAKGCIPTPPWQTISESLPLVVVFQLSKTGSCNSCYSNCMTVYEGTTQRLVAMEAIQAGQELTVSYLDICSPKAQRVCILLGMFLVLLSRSCTCSSQ